MMVRHGYQIRDLTAGHLTLYASGALLFAPATLLASFNFILSIALFVIASGLACLETAANPYITVLGDPSQSRASLELCAVFQRPGILYRATESVAPYFSRIPRVRFHFKVPVTYAAIAVVVTVIAVLIRRAPLPEIEEELQATQTLAPSPWRQRHFAAAVIAQFFYVAAQVGVGTFFINCPSPNINSIDSSHALIPAVDGIVYHFLLVDASAGTALMRLVPPALLLTIYAFINVALCASG